MNSILNAEIIIRTSIIVKKLMEFELTLIIDNKD